MLETGNLVERVFPMMGARFVAITDNYDSSKKDADLMVAVTNIANDLYAKDISKEKYIPVSTKQWKRVSRQAMWHMVIR